MSKESKVISRITPSTREKCVLFSFSSSFSEKTLLMCFLMVFSSFYMFFCFKIPISLHLFVPFIYFSFFFSVHFLNFPLLSIFCFPTYPNRFSDASASLLLRIKVPKSEERTNKERRRNEQKGCRRGILGVWTGGRDF